MWKRKDFHMDDFDSICCATILLNDFHSLIAIPSVYDNFLK